MPCVSHKGKACRNNFLAKNWHLKLVMVKSCFAQSRDCPLRPFGCPDFPDNLPSLLPVEVIRETCITKPIRKSRDLPPMQKQVKLHPYACFWSYLVSYTLKSVYTKMKNSAEVVVTDLKLVYGSSNMFMLIESCLCEQPLGTTLQHPHWECPGQ